MILPIIIKTTRSLCWLGLLVVGSQAFAQGDSDNSASQERLPEEIVVVSPASLKRLQNEMNKAEEAMFAVFNEFNDDERFDITCKMEKRYGSKILEHQCAPKYYRTALEEEAEFNLSLIPGIAGASVTGPGRNVLDRYNSMLEEKVRDAINTSPEFVDAVSHFEDLKAQYDEQRKVYFDGQ